MVELNLLLFAFLVLYIGQNAFKIWIDTTNIRHSEKNSANVPPGFEDFVNREKLAKMNAYLGAGGRLGIFEQVVSETFLLAIVISGFLPLLAAVLDHADFSLIPAGLLFFFIPGAIQFMVELPFSYYQTFVIEEKFGFNRSTVTLWVMDHIKSGLIGIVIFAVLFSILMLLIQSSPAYWWFWGFLLVAAVQVLLAVLFPVLIAPLFNKFEPVHDEELARRIMQVMTENGIRVKKILQMNEGVRSRHTNAYFTGIGKTKQIVLYDTLLESHTHDEILSVLAHEAGHFRKKHVLKQLVLFGAFSFAAFYVTYLLIKWPLLYTTFGFVQPLPYAGLFLAGIFWQKAGFFLQPLYMRLSRRFEMEADSFAVTMLRTAAPMVSALKRLAADNLSNLNPHPAYVWFHYSHPPILQRVSRLEAAQDLLRPAPAPETR